jgi:hypothetical protein
MVFTSIALALQNLYHFKLLSLLLDIPCFQEIGNIRTDCIRIYHLNGGMLVPFQRFP